MSAELDILKALSDPTRLRLALLLTGGELCVCDLTETLQLPQSTVSRHLSRLRQAGLVSDHRSGKWVYYRIHGTEKPGQAELIQFLDSLQEKEPYASDRLRLATLSQTRRCE